MLRWWLSLLLVASLGGCHAERPPANDTKSPPARPDVSRGEPLDDGLPETVQGLVDFMNRMSEPVAQTDPEQHRQETIRMMRLRAAAAKKLLSLNQADDYRVIASRMRMESLHLAASLGDLPSLTEGSEFADELIESANQELALAGRMGRYFLTLDEFLLNPQGDPATVQQALERVLQEHPDRELFEAASFGAQVLADTGRHAEAAVAFRQVGETFRRHKDIELAEQAQTLLGQAEILGLEELYQDLLQGEGPSLREVPTRIKSLLSKTAYAPAVFDVAIRVAEKMEEASERSGASDVWDALDAGLKSAGNRDDLAVFPAEVIRARRRLGLVGSTVAWSGELADGSPWDTASLEGRALLAVFWQSGSEICQAEMANLLPLYERFGSDDLVILGISLDEDRQALQEFLTTQAYPWSTLVSSTEARGIADPNAVACGVSSVPLFVLQDRKGKVVAYGFRVDQVSDSLEQLLKSPVE